MLWGALNNASTAMMAMSTDLGSISQNVSNVNTTGYKRTETMFKTMMSEHHASPNSYVGGLSIFGVKATQRNHIEAQGVIQSSDTWSDLAINGKGFFMVAPPQSGDVPTTVETDDPQSVLYTRDGSWMRRAGVDTNPNLARNYFTSASGNYLLGWMADDTGVIDEGGTLEPVYTLAPRPIPNNGSANVDETSTLTPSTQLMPGRATTVATVLATLPLSSAVTPTAFTSTMGVTDPNTATTEDVTFTWERDPTDPSSWTVTPSVDPLVGSVITGPITVQMDPWGRISEPAAGLDAVTVSWLSGASFTDFNMLGDTNATTSTTIADPNGGNQSVDLTWTRTSGTAWTVTAAFADPTVGTLDAASINVILDSGGNIMSPAGGLQNLGVTWDASYGDDLATSVDMRISAPSLAVADTPAMSVQKIPVTVYDDQFVEHTVMLGFEHSDTNEWSMYIDPGSGADPTAPVAPIKLYFNTNGTLDTTATLMPISTTLNWIENIGSPPTQTATTATFDLDLQKLSQFASSGLYLGHVSTDGYGQGNLIATSFTETGELEGFYTNGRSRTLFKVPVANFVSENALDPISGNLFRRTKEAGDVVVSAIDEAAGEGRFATSSLETSNTNIEDEFTRMIMTQKAYSTNAQVFKTADEMTSTARDLKR